MKFVYPKRTYMTARRRFCRLNNQRKSKGNNEMHMFEDHFVDKIFISFSLKWNVPKYNNSSVELIRHEKLWINFEHWSPFKQGNLKRLLIHSLTVLNMYWKKKWDSLIFCTTDIVDFNSNIIRLINQFIESNPNPIISSLWSHGRRRICNQLGKPRF